MTCTIRQRLIEAGILGEHQPRAADLWHVPADTLIEAGDPVELSLEGINASVYVFFTSPRSAWLVPRMFKIGL